MAHNPALLKSWENFRNHIVLKNALTPVQQEIAILRVAHNASAAYEWTHHVNRGKAAGLTDAQIEMCRAAPATWAAGSPDTYIMSAVDELMTAKSLSPASYAALNKVIGVEAILDLMAMIGMYITLAFIVKTFDVPMEEKAD